MVEVPREVSPGGPELLPAGILIIDDDAGVRSVVQLGLETQGFRTWTATGGAEGIELLRRLGKEVHLALVDVRMPELDGVQTLLALRQLDPALPICLVSADLGGQEEHQLQKLGANRVVYKPFRLHELVAVVKEELARVQPSP